MKLFNSSNAAPIRKRDRQGRLLLSGYQWNELAWHQALKLIAGGAAAVTATPIAVAAHGPSCFSLLLFAAFCLVNLAYKGNRLRVVAFDREGRVLARNGLPRRFWKRVLQINHASITSIEALREGEWVGVAIYTSEGQTFIVSELQRLGDARLVAVQLTKALHEMRHSLAVVHQGNTAAFESGAMVQVY